MPARLLIPGAILISAFALAPSASPQAEGAQQGAAPSSPGAAPKLPAGLPAGYLKPADLPDSLALLPPPPASGSPALARDEAVASAAQAFRGGPRWTQAVSDADLHFPHAASTYACAIGIPITPEATPHLYKLLGKTLIDVGLSTYRAKNKYNRVRPFVVHKNGSCTPAEEKFLSSDGSYPSGHSAAGWGWALVLTELAPDRADAILQRGRDFGQSRLVCNVHWQSDVDNGRVIAAATVARLHADPAFRADVEAAKVEIAAARAQGAKPAGDCAAEAAALRLEP